MIDWVRSIFLIALPVLAFGQSAMNSYGNEGFSPLTQCSLYPTSNAKLLSVVNELQAAAQDDPSCQSLSTAASGFMSAYSAFPGMSTSSYTTTPKSSFGSETTTFTSTPEYGNAISRSSENKSFELQKMGALNGMTQALANYIDSSRTSNCAQSKTKLIKDVQTSLAQSAVSVINQMSSDSLYAPLTVGLIGSVTKLFFGMFEGKDLNKINFSELARESQAEKMACLFKNFSDLYINNCTFYPPPSKPYTWSEPPDACSVGVLTDDIIQVQNFATSFLQISNSALRNSTGLTPENIQALQNLQMINSIEITSPNKDDKKTMPNWLKEAASYFSAPADNGYPRNQFLSKSINDVLAGLDGIDNYLRKSTLTDEDIKNLMSLNAKLSESLQGLNKHSISEFKKPISGEHASFINSQNSQRVSDMQEKGLLATLTTFFQSKYIKSGQYNLSQVLDDLDKSLVFVTEAEARFQAQIRNSNNPTEDKKHKVFNAILASSQKPIIEYMKSVKKITEPPNGKNGHTLKSVCEGNIQLAKNCSELAGIYFYQIGNNNLSQYGANILRGKESREFYDVCGDLISKGIISDPLEPKNFKLPGDSSEIHCTKASRNGFSLDIPKGKETECAIAFQKQACSRPPIQMIEQLVRNDSSLCSK